MYYITHFILTEGSFDFSKIGRISASGIYVITRRAILISSHLFSRFYYRNKISTHAYRCLRPHPAGTCRADPAHVALQLTSS
jgi:hypothetical protein